MASNKSNQKWYDPLLFGCVLPVFALSIRFLLISYRLISVDGENREREALSRSGGRAVYATWHQRLFFHVRQITDRDITVMVSQSRDGEYASRIINFLGIKDVRGSSTRGGRNALKELTQKVLEGTSGGMIVDGPLGPARVAKTGAVVLARDTNTPLIPAAWGTDRCWIINSWDRLIIPKPFARIVYHFGEPIWIPSLTNGEELEKYRKILEDRLNQGTRWCDEQLGRERPWRKVTADGMSETGPLENNR